MTVLRWAAPVGLATGLAAWMLAGGASANFDRLDGVESQLMAMRAPTARPTAEVVNTADLVAAPLFALTTGPGAIREPSIRLDGISLSRRRMAVLVSVDGKPSVWLTPGQASEGVTLQGVTEASATFDTALGAKTLNLGDQSAESSPDPQAKSAASPAPTPSIAAAGPPLRSSHGPPEPASAPRQHR